MLPQLTFPRAPPCRTCFPGRMDELVAGEGVLAASWDRNQERRQTHSEEKRFTQGSGERRGRGLVRQGCTLTESVGLRLPPGPGSCSAGILHQVPRDVFVLQVPFVLIGARFEEHLKGTLILPRRDSLGLSLPPSHHRRAGLPHRSRHKVSSMSEYLSEVRAISLFCQNC